MSKGWENFEVHYLKSLHCFEEKVGGKMYTKGESGEAFIMLKKTCHEHNVARNMSIKVVSSKISEGNEEHSVRS